METFSTAPGQVEAAAVHSPCQKCLNPVGYSCMRTASVDVGFGLIVTAFGVQASMLNFVIEIQLGSLGPVSCSNLAGLLARMFDRPALTNAVT